MMCDFITTPIAPNEWHHECRVCGRPVRRGAANFYRTCRMDGVAVNFDDLVTHPAPEVAIDSAAWGDRVEARLTKWGITEERVTAWLGRPCGCPERREKLNKLGRWFASLTAGDDSAVQEARATIG